jgi:hypothetical protein
LLSSCRFKRSVLVALLASFVASLALASSLDTPLSWFASRPLAQQTPWEPAFSTDWDPFLRQTYLMAELSQRAYRSTATGRAVDELGFREVAFIQESDTLDGDLGAFVGISAGAGVGATFEVLTGGATGGALTVLGGFVGRQALRSIPVEPEAVVVESVDRRVRVVSVRGTSPSGSNAIYDALLDANAGTIVDEDGLTYHHGFFLYASLLYPKVSQLLDEACAPGGTEVWLTGHSLGGAAAQLLAFWLDQRGCEVSGVMTFGTPSPGRLNFQRAYDARLRDITHRFMHENDPVACLPLGLDWARVGNQHVITDSGFRKNDNRDMCAGGGDLAGQVNSFVEKMRYVADPSTDYLTWLESTARQVGLCPENSAARWVLGILTGGNSELTCRTLDVTTDLAVLKDQLKRLHNLVLNESNPYRHFMPCGYIDRIAETGTDIGSFTDPIWAQRLEQTWELEDCSPPPPPAVRPRPALNAEGCPGNNHCCGAPVNGRCDYCVVSENICHL